MGGLLLVLDVGSGSRARPGRGRAPRSSPPWSAPSTSSSSATLPIPPLALTGLGFAVATVVSGVLGLVGLVPIRIGSWTVDMFGSRVSALVPLAVVVLIATALAYSIEVAAAAHIGPRPASFLALTEVLFATVAAAIVLGQIPGPLQALGGLVLIAGVVLVVSVPAPHRVVADEIPAGATSRSAPPQAAAPPAGRAVRCGPRPDAQQRVRLRDGCTAANPYKRPERVHRLGWLLEEDDGADDVRVDEQQAHPAEQDRDGERQRHQLRGVDGARVASVAAASRCCGGAPPRGRR